MLGIKYGHFNLLLLLMVSCNKGV